MRALKPVLYVFTLLGCVGLFLYATDAGAQLTSAQTRQSGLQVQPVSGDSASVSRQLRNNVPMDMDPTEDITINNGLNSAVYKRASLQNLSQSFIKLTGVDLNDDHLIDDFAIVNYCDLYRQYYADEFSWRQAREAFRRVIQRELESYPENVYLLGTISIGRYDFARKAFMLDEGSKFERTGVFRFQDRGFNCPGAPVQQLPLVYHFRLTNPITLDRLEIPEDKAATIRQIMEQERNRDRKVYVTFFIRINDFTSQGGTGNVAIRATTRATLMSMRVYLDRQRKIQIFEYNDGN